MSYGEEEEAKTDSSLASPSSCLDKDSNSSGYESPTTGE